MELQPRVSSIIATRLWKIVKIAFVMIRKRLMSKRNFISDMVDRARDRKLMREPLRSLGFNYYNRSKKTRPLGLSWHEYEFSCSNSPNPVTVHSAKNKSHRFPCMRLPKVIEDFVEERCTLRRSFSRRRVPSTRSTSTSSVAAHSNRRTR